MGWDEVRHGVEGQRRPTLHALQAVKDGGLLHACCVHARPQRHGVETIAEGPTTQPSALGLLNMRPGGAFTQNIIMVAVGNANNPRQDPAPYMKGA